MLQPKNLKEQDSSSSTFKMMIYGESDSGKTSSIKYLKGKTLLCDLDSSSIVLNGEDIDVITKPMLIENPSAEAQKKAKEVGIPVDSPRFYMRTFYDFVQENLEQYDNIVIDNLSAYQRDVETYYTKRISNKMQVYGKVQEDLLDAFFEILKINKNIIFTAWSDIHAFNLNNGQIINRYVPKVRDKCFNDIVGHLNIVAFAEKVEVQKGEDTQIVRGFRLSSTPKWFAKNQLDDRPSCLPEHLFDFQLNNNGKEAN